MTSENIIFTVYTPVFNSESTIQRLYACLAKQSYTQFEWLIINDGSKDQSHQKIEEICQSNSILTIRYLPLAENIGFNASMNLAVEQARGELFLIAHADDEITPDALEKFALAWYGLSHDQRQRLQGVKCNCVDQHHNFLGDPFPQSPWVSDLFEIAFRKKIKGEKWGFIRTDIMREFPFPVDEKFSPESLIWYRMYHKYPALYINENLRIYYVDHSSTSLMHTTKSKGKFALGKRQVQLDFLNHYLPHLGFQPILVLKIMVSYWKFSFLAGISGWQALKDMRPVGIKFLSLTVLPAGWLLSK